jgi:hypothetical protein
MGTVNHTCSADQQGNLIGHQPRRAASGPHLGSQAGPINLRHASGMNSRGCAPAFFALLCAASLAPADAALTVLPASPGLAVYLKVTQTTQSADGPQSTTRELSVRRRSADVALLEDVTTVWLTRVFPDGTIQLNEGPLAAARDTDLIATIQTLDQAQSLARGATAGKTTWSASIPLATADAAGPTPAPVPVQIQASGSSTDYDFAGSAQTEVSPVEGSTAQGEEDDSGSGSPRGGGGGFGRHHYGGSGARHDEGGGGPEGGRRPPPITVTLAITGRVAAGALTGLSLTQTRTLMLGATPYTNVSSWTVEVVRTTHIPAT